MTAQPPRSEQNARLRLAVGLVICVLNFLASGCASVFSKPVMSAHSPALPWLTGFGTPSAETAPAFDLTQIQPTSRSGIVADDLLEITIWDLYEPGKPHTFPSRVDGQGLIVVPHLDPIPVAGQSATEVEAKLIEAYRQHEVLKQPRILVRELTSAPIHIYVTGAVLRPGLVNLPRHEASVFAALVASGGLSRNAGLHVFVSDQSPPKRDDQVRVKPAQTVTPMPEVAGNSGLEVPAQPMFAIPPGPPVPDQPPQPEQHSIEPAPQQLVNHHAAVAVSADGHSKPDVATDVLNSPAQSGILEAVATRPDLRGKQVTASQPGRWYDLSVVRDRDALKRLVLCDGDVITMRPAAPPVRIAGAVTQPGAYRAPASNALTVVDAIQLAGGFNAADQKMLVYLTRPATAEHGMERWTFRMGRDEKLPEPMPFVQPGDLIHVEPTAQARVQSLMDSLSLRK